jgi:hypothetical protein
LWQHVLHLLLMVEAAAVDCAAARAFFFLSAGEAV